MRGSGEPKFARPDEGLFTRRRDQPETIVGMPPREITAAPLTAIPEPDVETGAAVNIVPKQQDIALRNVSEKLAFSQIHGAAAAGACHYEFGRRHHERVR